MGPVQEILCMGNLFTSKYAFVAEGYAIDIKLGSQDSHDLAAAKSVIETLAFY